MAAMCDKTHLVCFVISFSRLAYAHKNRAIIMPLDYSGSQRKWLERSQIHYLLICLIFVKDFYDDRLTVLCSSYIMNDIGNELPYLPHFIKYFGENNT